MFTAKVDRAGRLMIPIEFRKQLGLGEGSELIVRIEDGELRLHTRQQALERARRIFGAFKRSGESVVDEFLAERRKEARRELEE